MEDIKNMTGKKPGKYWWFTLAISSPILLTLFIVLKFINYGLKGSLTYKSWNKEETIEMNLPYPTWGYAAISISSIVCVLSMPLAIVLYKLNVFNLAEYLTADKKEKQNTSLKLNDFSKQRLDFQSFIYELCYLKTEKYIFYYNFSSFEFSCSPFLLNSSIITLFF